MRIFGPEGLRNIVDAINESNSYGLLEQRFPVEIVEVAAGANFEIVPGVTATTLKTPHTKESLALGLKDEDSKLFVYTSDTGFSEDLGPFAKHAALLLMECSFRRNKPVQKHLVEVLENVWSDDDETIIALTLSHPAARRRFFIGIRPGNKIAKARFDTC